MKRLQKLGALAALILPLAGALVFGSGPAYAATTGCLPNTKPPMPSFAGTILVNDTFESGPLKPPFTVTAKGTGTATISSAAALTGGCSAYLHVTDTSGSLANIAYPLPSAPKGYYVEGWFDIAKAGVAGNDVPYFRFFNGGNRIADIYRYNSNGQLWLRVTAPSGAFIYTKLVAGNISLGNWHHVEMHIIPNGNATTIEVKFDGKSVYSSNAVSTSVTKLDMVQLGAEHFRQMGDSYIDNVIIQSGK